MLRWMLRPRRNQDETRVEYIKRSTHECDSFAAAEGLIDWCTLYRQRKWKMAGKCARQRDGRWSTRLLQWRPWFRTLPYRQIGRPKLRWDDDISELAGGSWVSSALDADLWQLLCERFADTRA